MKWNWWTITGMSHFRSTKTINQCYMTVGVAYFFFGGLGFGFAGGAAATGVDEPTKLPKLKRETQILV